MNSERSTHTFNACLEDEDLSVFLGLSRAKFQPRPLERREKRSSKRKRRGREKERKRREEERRRRRKE